MMLEDDGVHPTYREFLAQHHIRDEVVHENIAAEIIRTYLTDPWLYMGKLGHMSGVHIYAYTLFDFLRTKGLLHDHRNEAHPRT